MKAVAPSEHATVHGLAIRELCDAIVETAKANGAETHAYLSLPFARLPYAKTVEDFETLLPWNVKRALTVTPSHLDRNNVAA